MMRTLALCLLLPLAASCGGEGDTPAEREERLLRSARNGDMKTVVLLLDEGVDLEARNPGDAWTPLMWAAVRNHTPLVTHLISRGARLEARDRKGLTAIMVAARWGSGDGVAALLDGGANIGATDDIGWNALMWAAFKGQTDMAALLLDRGARLEGRDPNGRTPLMLAAKKGHAKTVAMLLARGADITTLGPDRKTAADMAEKNGYDDLAKLLRAP
ncbi:MAG: ankyrin repeat domain-containing protein [Elusimicrobiota bacterium]|nr:ankyrin repeat domain-containing protein [Elusimicrobiota bacterium]